MTSRVETIVLGLLAEGERHGYDLIRHMEERGFLRWTGVSKVAVYKALARLEREGSLASWPEKDSNMPERRVFGITAEGLERLRDAVYALCAEEEPLRMHSAVGPAFLSALPPSEAREALERRLSFLEAQAKRIADERELLEGVAEETHLLILDHELRLYRVEASWLSLIIDKIDSGTGTAEAGTGGRRRRGKDAEGERKGVARGERG
ncbi:MAG: PadR family transcriptional regulator [Actinobacteria bacterium]|nr:PadR family transcriptional regulator [Actinomycetota bacterium]